MKRLISLILAFALIFSFSVSSFAEWSSIDSSHLATIANNYGYGTTSVVGYLSSILSLLNSKLISTTQELKTSIDNVKTDTGTIKSTLTDIKNAIGNSSTIGSIRYFLTYMVADLNAVREVVADEDDLRSKQASRQNQEAFTDEFLSGDNSVSTSDIGALSGLGTSFKDFFSMDGAGGGSAEVDISAWSDILVDDEPFTFFTEADTMAQAMGVEAGGMVLNPGQSYVDLTVHYYLEDTTDSVKDDDIITGLVSGTDYTVTAPSVYGYNLVSSSSQTITLDTSDNVVIFYYSLIPPSATHHLTYSGSFANVGSSFPPIYYPLVNGAHVSSGYELQDGDVITVGFGRTDLFGSSAYSLIYNGVSLSNSLTTDIYAQDIDLIGSYDQNSSLGLLLTLRVTYHSSAPVLSSVRVSRSAPLSVSDTSNQVVTHYYSDNLNALYSYLRGD